MKINGCLLHDYDLHYANSDQGLQIRASTLSSLLKTFLPVSASALKGINGVYEKVSREFGLLFENNESSVLGRTDQELFSADVAELLKRSDQQVCASRSVVQVVVCVPLQQGSIQALWIKYPVFSSDGSLAAIGIVVLESPGYDASGNLCLRLDQLVEHNAWLKRELSRFEHEAGTDKLTGTWNRRRFEESAIVEIERFRRYDHPMCLMIIDIDHFKGINDESGHVAGDNVLMTFTRTIQSALRVTDSLARWGGDEFVVLSPETNLTAMSLLAERLRRIVSKTSFSHGNAVTVSIGVAECQRDEGLEGLLLRADQALYRAKDLGRNQVQCSCDMSEKPGADTGLSRGFSNLVWHPGYECGHSVIDEQHRALFFEVNALLLAILDGHPYSEIGLSVGRLIGEAEAHFKDEERILADAGFCALSEHAAKHTSLIESAMKLKIRLHSGEVHVGEVFLFLAHDLVVKHMLSDDREFFPAVVPVY